MADDRPITPEQALLAVKAAGLDLDRPLNEQLGGDQGNDVVKQLAALNERLDDLAESLAPQTASGAGQQPHEALAERLAQAQSRWVSFGGTGGPDDGQAG
jgi:hypothetical protein